MNRIVKSLVIGCFILPIAFSSCRKDDEIALVVPPVVIPTDDCVDYKPTAASGTINGVWEEPNNKDVYLNAIVIPSDAGGGYVKVILSQNHPDITPWLTVDPDLDNGAAIISGSTQGNDNEMVKEAYFTVYPGMKYSMEASPFFDAPTNDYPVDYTITWEFISKVDCFEQNDSIEDAKKILLGDTIEAYAIAGYIDYVVRAGDPQTFDWYKVEVGENGILEAEVLVVPTDMTIKIALYNEDGTNIWSDFEWLSPGSVIGNGRLSKTTTKDTLSPGTYYIELHADFVQSRKLDADNEPLPDHFNQKYMIKTSLK